MKAAVIAYFHDEIRKIMEEPLEKLGIECRFYRRLPEDDHHEMDYLKDVEVMLAGPGRIAGYLEDFKKLRWLQSTWAGVETLSDNPDFRSGKVRVTNLKRTFGELIGEYVIGYMIAVHRNFFLHYENQKLRNWKSIKYDRFADKTVGLIGTGGIGSEIARKCFAFGMRVLGLNRTGHPVPAIDRIYKKNRKHEFLKQCDIIVMTLPLTNQSRSLVDRTWFRHMKKGVMLINAGRGKTVVQSDLIEALKNGKVGSAVLDVFEKEPLEKESPLWDMENVIITPHVAGITFPQEIAEVWRKNLKLYLQGKPLSNAVSAENGY